MGEIIHHHCTVPDELADMRLDQAVAQLLPDYSRSRLQHWIKGGQLTVNGVACKPKDKIFGGDRIQLAAEGETETHWQAQDISLEIVHEDDALLVLNKPAGLVVHPAAGHADGTLLNALLHHAPALREVPRAGIVHRLDKDTSGIMVVAKTLKAQNSLVNQLQSRTMGREYEALVIGEMTGGGRIDAPIGRHPRDRVRMAVTDNGKPATTHYRLLQRLGPFSHLRLSLESGRTHQIRVHMAHIKYPLVGDPLYGGRLRIPAGLSFDVAAQIKAFPRQALHACQLRLQHPDTGQACDWQVPLAEDMCLLIDLLSAHV